jgi:hypothetical protein
VTPSNERDPLDDWLERGIQPLPPPPGTFELIRKRARRRKAGRLAVTVTSAAAVAAVVAVGVPAALSLHLGPSATGTQVANGQAASPTRSSAASTPSGGASTATSSASPKAGVSGIADSATPAGPPAGGPVPSNFQPTSITFVSSSHGWAIGQGGTPGQCDNANPSICTSIVRTTDGGQTWHGIPAPSTNQVSGIRFLDGTNGWAYGPELWSTHDGGSAWSQVSTGGKQVIDLETAGSEAFALFATCASDTVGASADCTSYTLETTTAGTDDWSDVGPATTNLPDSADVTPTIVLSGTTGWLLGADGTIYSGPLTGAWTKFGDAPCPAAPPTSASPSDGAHLTWDAYSSEFVATCTTRPQSAASGTAATTVVYTSATSSLNWQTLGGATAEGNPTALATAPSAPAIVATSQGISVLDASTGQWNQAIALSGGFTYVGMTTDLQGVAIPADTSLHEIYMTLNGGQSWQASPITP